MRGPFLGGGGEVGDCSNGFPVPFHTGVDMGIGDTNSRCLVVPVVIFFLFYTNFFWNKTGAGNHVFSQLPASLNVLASK